jgi:hypothetical protein
MMKKYNPNFINPLIVQVDQLHDLHEIGASDYHKQQEPDTRPQVIVYSI